MTNTSKNNVALAHLYNEGKWCSKFGWVPTSGLGALEEITWQTDERMQSHAFPNETILAIFHLQVTLMTPTKFKVNWPLGSGEEAKNWFSRWPLWRRDFSYFWSTSHPNASYQVLDQLAFRFRRSKLFWSISHPDASYQVSSQFAFRFRRRSEK